MNLANKLTILRMFLVPVFLLFMAVKGIPYAGIIATIIFILASLTDKLDGYIARSRNQITNFGKFMDPLADKLLVTSALVSLVELQLLPAWAAMVIIAREFAVSGLRTVAASEGLVIAASNWGKAKTVIQMIAIILLLIKANIDGLFNTGFLNNFFNVVPDFIMILAVLITIVSGVDYFVKNKSVIKTNK